MNYILQTNSLTKKYKNFQALNGLTMNVPKGSIYGFVGKNGAGKTTLIRLICGLQEPTSGSFSLYGIRNDSKDIIKSRRRMGAVVETPSIYMDMTAEENLKHQYLILGLPSFDCIQELLKLVGLDNTGEKKAKNFSLGMKQRLGIAIALAGDGYRDLAACQSGKQIRDIPSRFLFSHGLRAFLAAAGKGGDRKSGSTGANRTVSGSVRSPKN